MLQQFQNNSSRKKIIFGILFFLIIILLIVAVWPYFTLLQDMDTLRSSIEHFGFFGPVFFIGVIILEVVVAPIPGGILPIASGFLFGFWEGLFYSYIGNILGSILAFLLSRFFGQPLINKFFSQKKVERANTYLKRYENHLIILYALPIFPIDIVSFLLGISQISLKKFVFILCIGFIPYLFILNFFGDLLFNASYELLCIFGFLIVISLVLFLVYRVKTHHAKK